MTFGNDQTSQQLSSLESPQNPRDAKVAHSRNRSVLFVVYALIPVLLLILFAEVVFRLAGLDHPVLKIVGLPNAVYVMDDETFFRNAPNQAVDLGSFSYHTNRFGLRNGTIGRKDDREFRILSLGESSTFGIGVRDEETYSDQLSQGLNQSRDRVFYSVLNAGVVGWSSFQSLQYLTSSGLALEPDLVVFYHEINDLLESGIKDSRGHVLGDVEYYESPDRYREVGLARHSAIVRFAKLIGNSRASEIHLMMQAPDSPSSDFTSLNLRGLRERVEHPRVTAMQRVNIIRRLHDVCQQHAIDLVVIHPSYRDSQPHECELIGVCRELEIPVLEAYSILHPDEDHPDECFLDRMHPNVEGHRRLADGLLEFLNDQGMLPEHDVSGRSGRGAR